MNPFDARIMASSIAMCLSFVTAAYADRLVLVAGGGTGGDGSLATDAMLHSPFGIQYDRSENLFIVELEGGHVYKIDPLGILTTIAGSGEKGYAGDGGPAAKAVFHSMHSLAVDPAGNVYLADTLNHRVRRIDAKTGTISTFAGTGKKGFGGDGGPASMADFDGVYCVAFNPDFSRLYLADLENRRIRMIDMATRIIHTVAGNGTKGVPADGAHARTAPLVDPRAVAADDEGNVYVLERAGHALRVVDRAGRFRTVVGSGKRGTSGDGGDARRATLSGPKHLCLDREGNVIIADTDNHRIRKYATRTGQIVPVAGSGKQGAGGLGGPPEQVELNYPHGVYVHADGTLYIADTNNHRVLKLVP